MIFSKTLWEFIEDTDLRINNVRDFLCDICPELNYNIVPISDPFGPAITDPTMELIVVSQETFKGGEKINLSKDFRLKIIKINSNIHFISKLLITLKN